MLLFKSVSTPTPLPISFLSFSVLFLAILCVYFLFSGLLLSGNWKRCFFASRTRSEIIFCVSVKWIATTLAFVLIRGQIHLLFSLANKLRGTRTIYYCKPTPSITTNVYYELYLMVDICLRTHSTQLHSLAHNNYGIIN